MNNPTDAQLIAAGRAYMAAACSGTATSAVEAMRAALGQPSAPSGHSGESAALLAELEPVANAYTSHHSNGAGIVGAMRNWLAGRATTVPAPLTVAEKLDAEAESKRRCYESTGDPQYLHEYGAYRHAARIVREQAAPAPTDLALALAAAQQSYCHPNEPEAGWCLIDRRHVETLCKAAQAAPATATTPAAEADSASGEVRHG